MQSIRVKIKSRNAVAKAATTVLWNVRTVTQLYEPVDFTLQQHHLGTSNVAFRNMLIYYSAVWFAPCPTTKLEDCLLQAVRDWLFNVLASAPRCPAGVFSVLNGRTHHVVAAKDLLNVTIRIILLVFWVTILFSQWFIRGSYRKSWATIFCKVTCFIIDKPNTPP